MSFCVSSPQWLPVMLTLEDRDVKWFTWAVVLTSLGYLLLLLVSIFPFWVRLVKDESQEVFFSGLFENCFQIKCWKPRPLSIYIVLGRVFLLCAVLFSFLTVFAMVSFASDLFPGTWKHNLVSAFISFLTGACAFLALLLHALEMQSLRMKPNPPHFSVQWPYYALGFSILLFVAAGYHWNYNRLLQRLQRCGKAVNLQHLAAWLVMLTFWSTHQIKAQVPASPGSLPRREAFSRGPDTEPEFDACFRTIHNTRAFPP
uniref:Transmembrane protein 225B n=1 Tax=Sus scrofa TaxID=9823 RepID=A0A8D1F3S5_PIG